jgi:hypothetical protein
MPRFKVAIATAWLIIISASLMFYLRKKSLSTTHWRLIHTV